MEKLGNDGLLKGSGFENQDNLAQMREDFVVKYSSSKGWDKNNLTNEQLLEIKSQKGYQCPGMICG